MMRALRFFAAPQATYTQALSQVNAMLGYPSQKAVTAFSPPATAVRRADGAFLLAVRVESLSPQLAGILHPLLASGAVVEITREEYMAAMPRGTP